MPVGNLRLSANRPRLKGITASYGLRRFYNPNHPVNIACGRKPGVPGGNLRQLAEPFTNSSHKCHEFEVGIEPTISEGNRRLL